jgi:TrmH family RNA methyltransferase
MEKITSLKNDRIKNLCRLSTKSKERKEQGLFILEGARELSLALSGNYRFDSLYICPALFEKTAYPKIIYSFPENILFEVTEEVFQKIAYRENSDGIIALAQTRPHTLSGLNLPENPLIILLEAIEKPGNLGAILRTADAAGVDAVIVSDPLTDIYNPNVIRSSVGCLFTVPLAVCSNQEAWKYLQQRQIKCFAAELKAKKWYHDTDFTKPSALVLGTEADGLTSFWINNADARIKIPMQGIIDSLNVSVSAAILTFEARRQRALKRNV